MCASLVTYGEIHVALAFCSTDGAKVDGISSLQEALSRHGTAALERAEKSIWIGSLESPSTQIFGEYQLPVLYPLVI